MDAVIVLAVFLICLGIPFYVAGLFWWFVFWWIIGGTLAATELIAKIKTGNTISKMFWIWRDKPETSLGKKISIFIGMVLFWVYLLGHLFLNW